MTFAAVASMVFYALSNLVLLILFNKIRKPLPIQDGTLCPACGYCLIGNTSMVCSECGRPFSFAELNAGRDIRPGFIVPSEKQDVGEGTGP